MIIFYGFIREFNHFNKDMIALQHIKNDLNTIGYWFTSDMHSAKPYAIGTETVFEKSDTEFWEDGEPKVVQIDKKVHGFVYKVFINEPNLKVYQSDSVDSVDSLDLFMQERDKYCDYLGANKRNLTWKDKAILLNKEEANMKFRKSLLTQGYEGFIIRSTKQHNNVTDLYCIFSEDFLQIVDVLSADDIQS
ncbi:hypothetical protein [Litchfieldia salsa]|uniref:Uncharacterized protein n=1 Tax=Litchfieldia salsa TaxID=930152 RepID=A0A1H0UXE7_9BACI|nr:hypothetical protein [Litchfieldia salsa]SDP70506.1 hypothetical protein SAMN05216565_105215 [Litchfieldia salsa]